MKASHVILVSYPVFFVHVFIIDCCSYIYAKVCSSAVVTERLYIVLKIFWLCCFWWHFCWLSTFAVDSRLFAVDSRLFTLDFYSRLLLSTYTQCPSKALHHASKCPIPYYQETPWSQMPGGDGDASNWSIRHIISYINARTLLGNIVIPIRNILLQWFSCFMFFWIGTSTFSKLHVVFVTL